MKNNFIKLILLFVYAITLQTVVFAEPNAQQVAPVTTSYQDAINGAATTEPPLASRDVALNPSAQQQATNTTEVTLSPEAQEVQQQVAQEETQVKKQRSVVNLLFKFILAMIWVGISSVVIYVILLSYKKFILKGKSVTPTYETLEHSLDTPKNFREAIKIFLDKTKWN